MWAASVIGFVAMLLDTWPTASIIVTRWAAARVGSRGNHDVEPSCMACIATSGGFDGSPAASTWVRPNEVSRPTPSRAWCLRPRLRRRAGSTRRVRHPTEKPRFQQLWRPPE